MSARRLCEAQDAKSQNIQFIVAGRVFCKAQDSKFFLSQVAKYEQMKYNKKASLFIGRKCGEYR